MYTFKFHLLYGLCFLSGVSAQAQHSPQLLSLEQALQAAWNANTDVRMAQLNTTWSEENYKQTQATYVPQVQLNYTALATDNPLNAFGFKLQQRSIQASDFNPALLNNPGTTGNFMTSMDVKQPLLNMDMLMQRKSAALQVQSNQYTAQRTKEQVTYQTQRAYLQLAMAYRLLKTLKEGLNSVQAQQVYIKNRFDQGLIQKSDLLNAEIQVKNMERQLSEVQHNIQNASDYLSLLMGAALGPVYEVSVPLSVALTETPSELPSGRADFESMNKIIQSSLLLRKSYQYKFLPRLNAFGSYYLNDRSMLGFGSGSYVVGIQLSWSILNGNSTAHAILAQSVQSEKLLLQLEEQKMQSSLALAKARREQQELITKTAQQKQVVEQATEVLNVVQNRYENGLALTNDLLSAQTQVLQQKLVLDQFLSETQILQAYLEFLTVSSH